MPDFNQLLLLIAVLSPLVVLVRTWRRAALNRSWRLAALAILAVTTVAWLLAPSAAGLFGGTAWLLLLFLPTQGLRRMAELAAAERFPAAFRLATILSLLHPARAVRAQRAQLQALALAQRGEREKALAKFAELASPQALRLRGDWPAALAWCEAHLPRAGLGDDPALLLLLFRSLGETGQREELVAQFAARAPSLLATPLQQPTFMASLALLFAFCGRTASLRRLLAEDYAALPEAPRAFWLATSLAAEGRPAEARALFEGLARQTADHLIRAEAQQRMARRGQLPPLPLTPQAEATLARFERGVFQRKASLFAPRSRGPAPAVWSLIALNLLMFAIESLLGGSTNLLTLHRLGALEPIAVYVGGQYWRLLAALFLHYGPLHLFVNVYALYVLGPRLERTIGSLRFALAYLVAGLGSSAGVLLLWRLRLIETDLLVGASGAVMGIVGLWAGILVGHRHVPVARRQLLNIGIIVVIQTGFDFLFPQVSMGAHLSGLVSGFLLGLFVPPKEPS